MKKKNFENRTRIAAVPNREALQTVVSSWMILSFIVFLILSGFTAFGAKNANHSSGKIAVKSQESSRVAAGCAPPTAQTDLDINNVRTTIMNGADMWWNLSDAKYEIPKGGGKHSIFAGALWIGGVDAGGQLKVAGMTYRQDGNDFFPGPLVLSTTDISAEECLAYDKHWKITRAEVQDFVDNFGAGSVPPSNTILTWPGNGGPGRTQFLAPFFDVDGDGVYDPLGAGDYPYYDLDGKASCTSCNNVSFRDILFGDQTLWWVFNDVGNIHSETGGEPIGIEVQAQAFAFTTNDEINNMTFYNYKIINRSSFQVNETYFGQWVDPDLGNYLDDYVGCDVARGLGYCYNGDAEDEGVAGYGTNPPAVGVDFFQGPLADPGDGIDNDRDCCVDGRLVNGVCIPGCEQIIMSKFVYYNNDFTLYGNPENATHYYFYLQGRWKDGTRMTYGGNGVGGGQECNFMFPGKSDHAFEWGTGGNCQNPGAAQADWDEVSAGNLPADRRFLQSAGTFTLTPGAVNYITTGVVWARAASGGPTASVDLLKLVDDKAQALFDNCFKVLNGPDAPDITVRELDKEVILAITNKPSSNNYGEGYREKDPSIVFTPASPSDTTYNYYTFQGYQIFQLKNKSVTAADFKNPDKARLVAQCDIKDGVARLINFNFDASLNANVPVEEVNGADGGIFHTFRFTTDAFATGNNALVNHRQYYYSVLAYAHNEYKKYRPDTEPDPTDVTAPAFDGQKKPYFAGRRNIKTYSAIPHRPMTNNTGQILGSVYGDGPKIRRIEGRGNGGIGTELTQESIDEILSSTAHRSLNPVYLNKKGPVDIKVYDPVAVPKGDFTLKFLVDTPTKKNIDTARWVLTYTNGSVTEEVTSERTIKIGNEQVIPKWGLSLRIEQAKPPGILGDMERGNGFIEGTIEFNDVTKKWLTGIADNDGQQSAFNWIRAGKVSDPAGGASNNGDWKDFDNEQYYERILDGTIAPYRLCSSAPNTALHSPAWNNSIVMNPNALPSENSPFANKMSNIPSVDIVFTDDKSKWTRCVIIELGEEIVLTEGNAAKFDLRKGQSVNKDGVPDGSGTGRGWFPGYAINVETGERLNMMFGEDSWLTGDNGRDMIWNPSSNVRTNLGQIRFGGKHYTYVMNSVYDEGERYYTLLTSPNSADKRTAYSEAAWVKIPLLVTGQKLLATDVKIRLRVSRPYNLYNTSASPQNKNVPLYTFNTNDLYNETNRNDAAQVALLDVNVVPNPYYAYSEYEENQLENKIKITNLPSNCVVSIYTLNGTLIRKFNRNVPVDVSPGASLDKTNLDTSLDWDLKNLKGIPISSGIYIIHVKAEGIGERTLKWFGVMRPIDLDIF